MKKSVVVLAAGALLIAVFAAGAYLYQNSKAEKAREFARQNAELFVRDYSPASGPPDARVTLVEFFDPACGTCKAFHPFVKRLMKKHDGKVRLVQRYAPFHPRSDYVVAMLEAARLQDKYPQLLDLIFAIQAKWASHTKPHPERIWDHLRGSGIDVAMLRRDMRRPSIAERIRQDVADARALGVTATPEFFVNGRPLPRFGKEELRTLLADEVDASY